MKENEYLFQAGDVSLNVKPAQIPSEFQDKSVNTVFYGQPDEYIRCPHCGELAKLDPQIYTSMPPKYGYKCSHCGKSGFIFCHEAQIITDPNWKP